VYAQDTLHFGIEKCSFLKASLRSIHAFIFFSSFLLIGIELDFQYSIVQLELIIATTEIKNVLPSSV